MQAENDQPPVEEQTFVVGTPSDVGAFVGSQSGIAGAADGYSSGSVAAVGAPYAVGGAESVDAVVVELAVAGIAYGDVVVWQQPVAASVVAGLAFDFDWLAGDAAGATYSFASGEIVARLVAAVLDWVLE